MHFFSATRAILVAAVAAATASAHNIVLPAHGLECFHENLHRDDKMSVTYQVGDREFGSAGNLDIDFWVRIPRAKRPPPPCKRLPEASNGDICLD